MLIPESITISGYKCFENVTIPLGNKITCLVGRNNSGKTSVIEVCKLLCTSFDYPEKNSMDGTQIDQQLLSETSPFLISLTFNIGSPAKFCPVLYSTVTKEHKLAGTEGIKILNEFNKPDCKIIFDIKYNSKSKMLLLDKIKINSVTLFQDSISSSFHMPWNTSSHFSYVHVSSGNRKQISLATSPLGEVSNLLPAFIKSIKFISVDRYIPTRVDNHNNTTENENLSATAKLLQYWSSSKRSKFNAIIRFLNSLDDSIGDLRFEPFNSSLILKFAKNMEQDSADVSLENCGSGIKQLLGMATFVLNDEADQYIIIDEPQAFLHPHAEELFVDLISLTKNNFLIATHSPVFINAASDGIVLLKKNNGISKAITNNNGTSLVKDIARELGTSAHQLVVAKGILFVEGETEVSILENITAQDNDLKSALKNYLVRSIPATGMVTGKGKPVTRDLLKDIQNSIGLNTIIILDKIKNSQDDLGGRVVFTEFEMIEDLFIDIDIISKSLTILATEKEAFLEINVDNISGILADKTLTSSKKLNELFLKYFRAEYDKVKHGRLFAKIIYQHKPQLLEPFVSKIKQAISKIEKA